MLGYLFLAGAFFTACLWLDSGGNKEKDLINAILKENVAKNNTHAFIKSVRENVYFIDLPVGLEFSQLQKAQGKIENAIQKQVVIENNNFTYTIEVVEPVPIPTLAPFEFVKSNDSDGLELAIGTNGKKTICLNLKSSPHSLIAGATGSGKSVFLKGLILQILHNCPDAELELFDFKAGIELSDFKDLKQANSFTIYPDDATEEIERIYGEINERFNTIKNTLYKDSKRKKCRDIFEYNQSVSKSKRMNYKFVIIEEFTVLLGSDKDELETTLTKCLAISRATGTYFIFTSQRFSSRILNGDIKANAENKICFRVSDKLNGRMVLDSDAGAEKISVKGRGIFSQNGHLQEFQSFYVSNEEMERYLEQHLQIEETKEQPILTEKGSGTIWR